MGQNAITNFNFTKPPLEFDNIHIQRISSDSLSSTFVIWIKQKVRLHKHLYHKLE